MTDEDLHAHDADVSLTCTTPHAEGDRVTGGPSALLSAQQPFPSERAARAALSRLAEPGDLYLHRLIERWGAVATYSAICGDAPMPAPIADEDMTGATSIARPARTRQTRSPRSAASPRDPLADYRARRAQVDPERDMERARRYDARLVCPGDEEWPSSLTVLAHAPPMYERGGPPIALWVRGNARLDETLERSVAIVGARAATEYGCYVASELAAELGARKVTTVSGAAFGIDAAVHRGSLASSGPTVAVVACGIDVAYPRAHRQLLDTIADEGLIVSEHPPGVAPHRLRFLVRNRLIAALTLGTVVVEAAVRSGALNTANWALSSHRELMAVPGPTTSPASAGVHRLIRAGAATLVTDAEEVLEQVGRIGSDLAPDPAGEMRSRDELPLRERRVLDAVPVIKAQGVARIAGTAGVAVTDVLSALGALEAADYVERDAGGWRLSTRERSRRRHTSTRSEADV